jgi:hypothetical protein
MLALSLVFVALTLNAPSVLSAPAASGLDVFLARNERERREQAATMERVTLFVQATGRDGSVRRGSGLALEGGRILTLASVVGDDADAVLFAAGENLPPTPAHIEAKEERKGDGSDFVLLRFTPPPSFVLPAQVPLDDARPGDRITAWGCVGTPLAMKEDRPEGTAYVYIPPPPLGSEGLALSAEAGDMLRHSALPAAGAAGGPVSGRGNTLVGLIAGVPETDDRGVLSAPARPAPEMAAFLRAHGMEVSYPAADALTVSGKAGDNGGRTVTPEKAGGDNTPSPLAGKDDGSGDPDPSSEEIRESDDPTLPVAALLCSERREDREKGAALLHTLVSRRDADPESLALFAWALRAGILADADEREAPAAAEKAAKAGSSLGKAVLGLLYRDALLLPADPRKARALAEESAAEGETLGISLLALLEYESGSGDARREALPGAEKAAAAGDAAAMGLAACLYALHGDFIHYRAAEKPARAAADRSDVLGLYILALLYRDGMVTERDPARAWACAKLSLDRESGPHLEERKALFGQLDEQLTEREKENGRLILRALLMNRRPV